MQSQSISMQSHSRSGGVEPTLYQHGPRPSMSRERTTSGSGAASLATPPPVFPEPAYIAASAASQIVTSDHQTQTDDWFEERSETGESQKAVVSPTSLTLVNAFLDQLLFSFLGSARSTSIAALRPAVSDVLKPRLAKEAINGADQELEEFLGGDEEELSAFHNGLEPRRPWDLHLVWRRTRLRCMVYTRLGDMEEEDEEAFLERERAEAGDVEIRRLSRDLGIVSPAAAIFLTSIVEFIGEQVLMLAGEAAYARVEAKKLKDLGDDTSGSSESLRVVVEDLDMEKLAFNTTFGRLWRSWKKRVRTPSMMSPRAMSRDFGHGKESLSPASKPTSGKASISEVDEANVQSTSVVAPSVEKTLEKPHNSEPGPNTLDEENALDDDTWLGSEAQVVTVNPREAGIRPRSMVISGSSIREKSQLTPPSSVMQHRRSSSLPALHPAPYSSPLEEVPLPPSSFKDRSLPLRLQETSLQADPIRIALETSATTTADACDDSTKLAECSTADTDLQQISDGMSKEEFDRQMLALVRDIDHRTSDTPDSNTIDQSSYPSGLASNLPHGAADGESASESTSEHSRSELPNRHDVYENTVSSWRDAENVPGKVSPANEGFVAEPTQGERPRTASSADHEYGLWECQAPYFYHGPATSNTNQNAGVSPACSKEPHGVSSTGDGTQPSNNEHGVPRLTPLRELMEAAHDTSDEASSLALSHEASHPDHGPQDRFRNSGSSRAESLSFHVLSQAKPAPKLSDLRSNLPAVNTGTERAAVQRISPSPISAREPMTPVPQTSTSSNWDSRPTQTSSSSTSQVSQKLKGLVGRDSSDGRHSSEGSGSVISDKRSLRTPTADEAQRSFDQLIKSDETIQYTLTPQNMREMEDLDLPRWNPHKRIDTAEMADFFTRPEEAPRPSTSRSFKSLKALNGLAANSVKTAKPTEPSPTATTSAPTPAKTPPRPTTSHTQSAVAREARTNSESTRDFADFLRSTGPSEAALAEAQAQQQNQQKGPPIVAPKPINALPAVSRPASGHGPKKITKQNPSSVNQPAEPPSIKSTAMPGEVAGPIPLKSRIPKLQAREPTVARETSSDLIDFIRQGPSDRSEGRLRLPPTGDPAQPIGDTNGSTKGVSARFSEGDRSRLSVASTQLSSVPSKSGHSINSRTGLLESGSPTSDARHQASESIETRSGHLNDISGPVRKQHRNKDPYAIDTDSEGDGDTRAPPRKAEESLIDFLNSVTPPPSPPATRKAFVDGSTVSKSPAPSKNQYPSMRDRLTRGAASGTKSKIVTKEVPMGVPSITRGKRENRQVDVGSVQGRIPASQPTQIFASDTRGRPEATYPEMGNRVRGQEPKLPPLNPRETSPHLISQVGTKRDTYRITHPTYAAHVDRERTGGVRRLAQHHQARGNREPDHGLSDLADFLKNSEPPTAPTRVESSPLKEREKESGFGRMFSRRRKNSQT